MWVRGSRIEPGQVIRLDPLEAASVFGSGRAKFSSDEDAKATREGVQADIIKQGAVSFTKKGWSTNW